MFAPEIENRLKKSDADTITLDQISQNTYNSVLIGEKSNDSEYFKLNSEKQLNESEGDFPETSRTGEFPGLQSAKSNDGVIDPILDQSNISLAINKNKTEA